MLVHWEWCRRKETVKNSYESLLLTSGANREPLWSTSVCDQTFNHKECMILLQPVACTWLIYCVLRHKSDLI